ncbi:hypothetical protein [Granulosicoccus antarcticus]|uniref:Alginate export domain-containing protein n=1 Tax=Granulosicoccus antarcticus IMCC3135 TaxID=1192854 RepID=A0A2Z2NGR7_9GAMM|nr:hypothetical protein [Granulosicoccus antarcticus]ASJ70263.1 hypothetical protein IMCC3135_00685 [Granulosicoccus antarcticus IMCC3135]
MRKRLTLLLLSSLFVVFAGPGQAEDAKEDEVEKEPGMVIKAGNYIDGAQGRATESFEAFMTRVDGFFTDASTNSDVLTNDSWARIKLDTQAAEGGTFEMDPSVKIRVSLPNTERRFKLLFSTEGDDTDSVGDNIGGAQSTVVRNNQNASAAIRFIRSARKNGNTDVDLGVRQREGDIQYFGRVSLGYRTKLKRRWDFSASNSYWHYNKSGFENRLTFDFRRVLFYNEDFFFRSFSELSWRKGNKGAITGQTLGLYTQFGERKALALEALASYHTALNEDVLERYRGHEFRIRWRHSIWRPWFSYEVWPSVSWLAENDYERLYSLLFRLEMTIGKQ